MMRNECFRCDTRWRFIYANAWKNKSLMPLASLPLIEHALNRLIGQVDRIIINTNGNHSDFDRFGLPIVSDSIDGFLGPLSGILAGMDYAAECGYSHLLTVAADTPFFQMTCVRGF